MEMKAEQKHLHITCARATGESRKAAVEMFSRTQTGHIISWQY